MLEKPSPAPHPVALVFDGTFFSQRDGLLVYRVLSRNIYWREIDTEKLLYVEQDLRFLAQQGWHFSSFTIDGRQGIIRLLRRLFPGIPIQMCLFHQAQTIRRYTTLRPQTDCGKAIRQLMATLTSTDEQTFLKALQSIKNTHADFLAERNEQGQFMHRRLRSALRSLTTNAPHLFTHRRYPELAIPTTTNSCDGSFAHWKAKIKIHRGLQHDRKAKMINYLLAKS